MILQDYAPKSRPTIRKPIISITRNPVLGTTIVFRSPFSRAWIGNITLAMELPRINWAKCFVALFGAYVTFSVFALVFGAMFGGAY